MKRILDVFLNILIGGGILFLVYVFIRWYWLVSCSIPTYSMSPTLTRGDYIIASMQIPGRRVYEEIPSRPGHYSVTRKKGTREIQKGDVVVFNFPYTESKERMKLDNKVYYCKRCVALPGETHQWTLGHNQSTQIYIPLIGDVIPIDTTNYNDYAKCIEYETGKTTRIDKEGKIYLADSVLQSYRFRHNYYFMAGDNVGDSYDSRFWGLLPDDFILGVGHFIWFSQDRETKQIRWKRMFKKL